MSTNPTAKPRIDGRLIGIMATVFIAVVLYGTQQYWIPNFHRAVAYLKNESADDASHDGYR